MFLSLLVDILVFITIKCAESICYDLLPKFEIISYVIGVGHEMWAIIGYWYQLKKIHILHSYSNLFLFNQYSKASLPK